MPFNLDNNANGPRKRRYKWNFGVNKGKFLDELPDEFLLWVLENHDGSQPGQVLAVQDELDDRKLERLEKQVRIAELESTLARLNKQTTQEWEDEEVDLSETGEDIERRIKKGGRK